MEQELSQYHQSNGALKLMISEIKLKITGMTSETELQSKGLKAHDNFILKIQVRTSLKRPPPSKKSNISLNKRTNKQINKQMNE